MKSLKVTPEVHADLEIVQRVYGTKTVSDTIREMMNRLNYNQQWFEYITNTLEGSA